MSLEPAIQQAARLSYGTLAVIIRDALGPASPEPMPYAFCDEVCRLWYPWLEDHGREYETWQAAWHGFLAEQALAERLAEAGPSCIDCGYADDGRRAEPCPDHDPGPPEPTEQLEALLLADAARRGGSHEQS